MKRILEIVSLVLLASFAGPGNAQAPSGKDPDASRHVEKAGGFSFVPPDKWKVREWPGRKFKIAVGPAERGFGSNIVVADEAFDGTLDEYVKETKKSLEKAFKKYRLVKQEEFKTATGITGARLIIENEQGDKLLRQTFYLFGKPKTMFIVACSTLAEGGDKLDPVFEKSAKTFRFDKE